MATFRNLFSIDPRSLALFRVSIAALLLIDLAIRATDLSAMYTDDGMFSRAEICRRATSIWNWSFHFGGGSFGYQAFLFSLAAALAISLLLGYESRLVTIASWLMLISLHHRVPPILSGAEILLRTLLFWAMFLPLGRAWSLDRRLGKIRESEGPVFSIASAAILLQMALMYLFSAYFKSNPAWFSGEAIAGTLRHDFYASPLGASLLQFPGLLKGMTWGTLALEWVAPFLLFIPIARLRIAIIALLAAMHLGIGFCLEVGLFSYVSIAGLTLFLPAQFWDRFSTPHAQNSTPFPASRFASIPQALCLLAFLYVLAVNINGLPSRPLSPLAPDRWKPMTTGLGLGQRWGMFESVPSRDGWCVAHAKLRDGSDVDLLRQGAPVDWSRPEFPTRFYPNHFWKKLFREMSYDDEQGFQLMRAPVAEYLCRDWNARHPAEKQVVDFKFIFNLADKNPSTNFATPKITRERLLHFDFTDP